MDVAIKIDLIKEANFAFRDLKQKAQSAVISMPVAIGVTTGIGEDLFQAARDAVSGMIEQISKGTGMTAIDAYMLCSVCGDLRISEIVDMPNWTVSFYFPKIVFG